MAYSNFSYTDVKQKFNIQINEKWKLDLIMPVQPSPTLVEWLSHTVKLGLASNNEKARSEFMVVPVLAELKHLFHKDVSLFSGVDFNVDADRDLIGTVDFLITRNQEQLIVESPVVMMFVQAKKEDLFRGLGQCIAEMIAARIFNERAKQDIPIIYGAVTTGSAWKFLKLEGQVVSIDPNEYRIGQLDKILSILASMIAPHKVTERINKAVV